MLLVENYTLIRHSMTRLMEDFEHPPMDSLSIWEF